MKPQPRVTLHLLGSPRLERAGKPVKVDTRKAIALMAHLALTRERQGRDKLAAFLWPDADDGKAHAALRRTLSVLNKALGGAGLDIERETIAITPEVWVDVNAFRGSLAACHAHGHPATDVCERCLPALAEAVALYRDDFLAGFTLRDSLPFDDWQFFQNESLRRELAGALERLVRGQNERREFESAIQHARRWLALDSLHEPAHRCLMQLYEWTNQRAAAVHQYRECARILKQELGVPPLEETTRLYEAIKNNQLAKPGADRRFQSPEQSGVGPQTADRQGFITPSVVGGRPSAGLPLVGRSAQWQALLAAYDSAHANGQLVVLEGEAGIGKTRLAEEFLAHVGRGGATVLTARCYAGQAGLAYGPIMEAVRAALAQPGWAARLASLPAHHRAEAARLWSELNHVASPGVPSEGPGAQSRFLEGVRQTLLTLCHGLATGVLWVDDTQWADEASLDLLVYLARRLREQPVMMLMAWRAEDVPAYHRLHSLFAEAGRMGLARVIPLSRLGLSDVAELAQSGAIRPELVERLYRETEGSPFFLVEYLAALAQHAEVEGEWSLPAGVRELLSTRLADVTETGGQLLSAAAVIGRSFDLDTVQAASGRSDDETVAALEELVGHRIVVEVGHPSSGITYDFSHEKLRGLVYDQTSLARRRLLHRRVAEALVGQTRRSQPLSPLTGQIAQHFRLGGREAEAAHYFKLAGDYARALYANAEALALYRSALTLGHPQTAALHEAIGDLQTLVGDYAAALASYETAAATSAPGALATLEHKLANLYDRRGDWELAESHFRAALSARGEPDPTGAHAQLYADWSRTAHHRGQAEYATELARRALELAEAAHDSRALARAHNVLGLLASHRSAFAEAREHLQSSLTLAESLRDPDARIAALNNLALACREDGDLPRALALTEQALALCSSLGDRHREAALHNNLADLHHASGDAAAAMSHLKQAVARFVEVGGEPGAASPGIWKLTEW